MLQVLIAVGIRLATGVAVSYPACCFVCCFGPFLWGHWPAASMRHRMVGPDYIPWVQVVFLIYTQGLRGISWNIRHLQDFDF